MGVTFAPVRPVTDDELLKLSERNPGYQFERTARGELIVTPTGGRAGQRELELAKQLGIWTDQDRRGVAFSPSTMFVLPDGSRFMPDASWVQRDRYQRLTEKERQGWLPLCPDAAFEIASPSDHLPDLQNKIRTYVANGAKIAVLIDPDQRAVEVYRPGREPEIHRDPAAVALGPELPGFVLDLKPLFES
jgi:Uma2 family endonuclease